MTSYCMLAATKREYNCDPMILWYHGTERLKHCLSPFTPSFPEINQEPNEDARGRLCSNSKTKFSILLLCPHLLILEWIWRRQALANLEASHLWVASRENSDRRAWMMIMRLPLSQHNSSSAIEILWMFFARWMLLWGGSSTAHEFRKMLFNKSAARDWLQIPNSQSSSSRISWSLP